jgi:glutathione S-transferase-like protein
MAVILHRCSTRWVKGPHPCWRVESALIDMNVPYEVHAGSGLPWRRESRAELIEKTGQNRYPALELEDGTVVKAESAELERRIRAGELGSPPAR